MCDFICGQAHGGSEGQSAAEPLSKKGRQWRGCKAVRPQSRACAETVFPFDGQAHGGSEGQSAAEPLSKNGRQWRRSADVRPHSVACAETDFLSFWWRASREIREGLNVRAAPLGACFQGDKGGVKCASRPFRGVLPGR